MDRQIDTLAGQLRRWRVVLCYKGDGAGLAFRYRGLPTYLRREIRNHRRGLARLMAAGDWRLCASPEHHRASWRYAGQGVYTCEICRRIDAQLGMWKAS